jgi:hypothetical protein
MLESIIAGRTLPGVLENESIRFRRRFLIGHEYTSREGQQITLAQLRKPFELIPCSLAL